MAFCQRRGHLAVILQSRERHARRSFSKGRRPADPEALAAWSVPDRGPDTERSPSPQGAPLSHRVRTTRNPASRVTPVRACTMKGQPRIHGVGLLCALRAQGRRCRGLSLIHRVGLGGDHQRPADLGSIDSSKTGSLVILSTRPVSNSADGTRRSDGDWRRRRRGHHPFTAYRITNLDLTTQAAWDRLKSLAVHGRRLRRRLLFAVALNHRGFDGGTAGTPDSARGDTTIGNTCRSQPRVRDECSEHRQDGRAPLS